jgi:hypothetical protein
MISEDCLQIFDIGGRVSSVMVIISELVGSEVRRSPFSWKAKQPREALIVIMREPAPGPRDWSPRAKKHWKKGYEVVCQIPMNGKVHLIAATDAGMTFYTELDWIHVDAEVGILAR